MLRLYLFIFWIHLIKLWIQILKRSGLLATVTCSLIVTVLSNNIIGHAWFVNWPCLGFTLKFLFWLRSWIQTRTFKSKVSALAQRPNSLPKGKSIARARAAGVHQLRWTSHVKRPSSYSPLAANTPILPNLSHLKTVILFFILLTLIWPGLLGDSLPERPRTGDRLHDRSVGDCTT